MVYWVGEVSDKNKKLKIESLFFFCLREETRANEICYHQPRERNHTETTNKKKFLKLPILEERKQKKKPILKKKKKKKKNLPI